MTDLENSKRWEQYFYPGTEVFINKFDCRDEEKLKEIESTITFEKLLKLNENESTITPDKNGLKELHKYVFGDIYPFAGKYRTVNMKKEIGTFLHIDDDNSIDNYLDYLFKEINISVNGCDNKAQFSEAIAKLYTRLIYCHPFREGNGRVVREFVREFTSIKSKESSIGEMNLDWSLIDRDELNSNLEVAHIFPGVLTPIFSQALVSNKKQI